MKKILVIGESCLDIYQYGSAERLAPEAPVPVFKKTGPQKIHAGMASNVYNNVLSLCNFDVTLMTNDNYEEVKKIRFIDTRTNYVVLRLDENDQMYQKKKIKTFDFSIFDVIIISDYNKGFLTKDEIRYISNKNNNVFLDTKKILGSWASEVKYIKINEYEYKQNESFMPTELQNKLIITRGSSGADHLDINYPVEKVEIKDTCGAGDTFIAALAVSYLGDGSISNAIKFANQCATKVVQKKGVSVV